jgi:hypothetical protein
VTVHDLLSIVPLYLEGHARPTLSTCSPSWRTLSRRVYDEGVSAGLSRSSFGSRPGLPALVIGTAHEISSIGQ